MKKILFVCMGNICRSPTAEGYFAKLVSSNGLADKFEIDSAGTHGYHVGSAPDKRSQHAAAQRGFFISNLRARQIKLSDFSYFDYILVMDQLNLDHLQSLCPMQYKDKITKFLEFAPESGIDDVPDPYQEGADGFELVLDLIEAASFGFLNYLQKHKI
jgi:protein-tyrosine phosphatase